MVAPASKLVIDTNLYIQAARSPELRDRLGDFMARSAPRCYLLSIVAMELLAGARDAADGRRLRRDLIRPFERRGRLLTPSAQAVLRCVGILSAMRRDGSQPAAPVPAAFLNDLVIAATCVEHGVLLHTHNTRDFSRIDPHLPGLRFASF
jgi:predicted nucleic acid-binding protein